MYFIVITVTTVGYGDFYPLSIFGRLLAFLIFIWGAFFVSLSFVILMRTVEMDSKERNALNLIRRIQINKQVRDSSAVCISRFFRLLLLYKRFKRAPSKGKKQDIQKHAENLLLALGKTRHLKRKKGLFKDNNLIQSIIDNNQYYRWFLKDIGTKQKLILDNVLELKLKLEENINLRRFRNSFTQKRDRKSVV